MPIFKGESSSKGFNETICSITHITSQNTNDIRIFSEGQRYKKCFHQENTPISTAKLQQLLKTMEQH